MKDTNLLPYILPNVFVISQSLSPPQFASTVLPSLKPLFVIKDPPQNMLTLLDNLTMIQNKTEKGVFRERTFCVCCTDILTFAETLLSRRAAASVPRTGV